MKTAHRRRVLLGFTVTALGWALAACGGTQPTESSTAGAGGSASSTLGGSSGALSSTSSMATTGGGGGSVASQATSFGSTTGSSSQLDCSGDFGEPAPLFVAATDAIPQSFTVSPEELELMYVSDAAGVRGIERRLRESRAEAFGEATTPAELSDACDRVDSSLTVGTIDLSPDGLTLYISCEVSVTVPATLVIAQRADLSSPFQVDTTLRGEVGPSFATADGREGYSNAPDSLDIVDLFRRDDEMSPFTNAGSLAIELRSPDPSDDGLRLYGTVPVAGSDSDYRLAVAERSSTVESFGPPSVEGLPAPPEGFSDATPAVSGDCRALYFLRYSATMPSFVAMRAAR